MRKITREAADAFWGGYSYGGRSSNTLVYAEGKHVYLELFGHRIARRKLKTGRLEITTAGHETNTTKERLNGVMGQVGAHLWTKAFYVYWSGPASYGKSRALGSGWTTVSYGQEGIPPREAIKEYGYVAIVEAVEAGDRNAIRIRKRMTRRQLECYDEAEHTRQEPRPRRRKR